MGEYDVRVLKKREVLAMKRHEIVDFYLRKAAREEAERPADIGANAMNFWAGFDKRAAETYVQAAPPAPETEGMAPGAIPPEKMLKWNDQGGVDPRSPEDMAASETSHLITLPHEIEGANCGSCVHFRALNPELGSGFCTNPAVKQDVTVRMLCANWDHPGIYSAAEAAAEEAALQQQAAEEAAMAGQAVAEGDPMAQNIMSDFQGGNEMGDPAAEGGMPSAEGAEPADGGTPPKKESKPKKSEDGPKKKDSEGKSEGKGGHTININVGKEKVATEAFLAGFAGRAR